MHVYIFILIYIYIYIHLLMIDGLIFDKDLSKVLIL